MLPHALLELLIYYNYYEDYVVSMQNMLTLALICKFFEELWHVIFYAAYSTTGYIYSYLGNARDVFEVIAETIFLAVLLLTAMGWTITRDSLTSREKQMFWSAFLLFVVFKILHGLCQDPNLCGAYLLSFHVVKFLITFGIIVAMNANVERLRAQTLDFGLPQAQADIYTKLKMFQNFRWAFLAYLIIPIILLFVNFAVVSWQQFWVIVLLEQLLFLAVYIMVGYTFRPRPRNEYFTFNVEENDNENEVPLRLFGQGEYTQLVGSGALGDNNDTNNNGNNTTSATNTTQRNNVRNRNNSNSQIATDPEGVVELNDR